MTRGRVEVALDDVEPVPSVELEGLLRETYVGGGFTDEALAREMFQAASVRARGKLLLARAAASRELVGMIIVVPRAAESLRIATEGEGELHLLAVAPTARGRGIGRELVQAAQTLALATGTRALVLWTQSSMHAAQRLYEAAGFCRAAERDFDRAGRQFLVYTWRR